MDIDQNNSYQLKIDQNEHIHIGGQYGGVYIFIYWYRQKYQLGEYIRIGIGRTHIRPTPTLYHTYLV
jgi:hypothetical protein